MARVILLTDFGESYAKDLLKGLVEYSREREPWVFCRMPLSYRDMHGIEGVLKWAIEWKADAIIGQFYNEDNIELFAANNIIAIAQDFKSRFSSIPNITGDHHLAGKIGADYFIQKGFEHYAFLGVKNIVWSEERCQGFKDCLTKAGVISKFHEYHRENMNGLWYYEEELKLWLERLPKPIAIMACDDNQANHIAEICNLQNIEIPRVISLLGVDNDETICILTNPPLSSLCQGVTQGGHKTGELIDKLIENPDFKWKDVIVQPTHIITRDSTDTYSTSDPHMATVLKHIHQNINQKLNVNDLTKLVPLSRRLLEIRFKKATGKAIYSYILNLRIEKFAKQLIETDKPIINIVLELGSIDYNNISRQFKDLKGCTPSEYRIAQKQRFTHFEDVNT